MPKDPSKVSVKRLKTNPVWRHNAAIGQTIFAIKALQGVAPLPTLTDAARTQTSVCIYELEKLRKELTVRKDL